MFGRTVKQCFVQTLYGGDEVLHPMREAACLSVEQRTLR